jgi:hypothetical protein
MSPPGRNVFGYIRTVNHPFVQHSAYPSPEGQELEKQVRELLETGHIVPSCSSYGATVLFVPKPAECFRMCIDCRELKLTVKNTYPIPRIDELIDEFEWDYVFFVAGLDVRLRPDHILPN